MTEAQIRAWLLDYAWSGTEVEKDGEVDCIMAQGGWKYLDAQTERYAGQAFASGPASVEEAAGFALSALYECHDAPHLPSCHHYKWEKADELAVSAAIGTSVQPVEQA